MRAVGFWGVGGFGCPAGSMPPITDWGGELCGRVGFLGVGGCWPPVGVTAPDYRLGGIVRAGGFFEESGVFGCPAGSMPPTTDWGLFGWRVVFFDL
jgi:hypothetical protein